MSDVVARLNAVFRKNAKVDCAILKNTYCNDGLGSEFHHYPDDGKLLNCGYSYEFLSDAMLEFPVCKVTNGKLTKQVRRINALIIDGETYLSTAFFWNGSTFWRQTVCRSSGSENDRSEAAIIRKVTRKRKWMRGSAHWMGVERTGCHSFGISGRSI